MKDATLSRRDLLKSTSAIALLAATGGCEKVIDKINNRPTRRNVSALAPNDPILQTYRDAITMMQALPATDGRNWTKQAQIHQNACPHSNWYFLPWHRAYLYRFEQIIRTLTGNAAFALPYWNWTIDSKVPDVFWGASNPLNHARGTTQGQTMNSVTFGHPNLETILSEPNFLLFGSGAATTQRGPSTYGLLEGGPHNAAHGFVGGDMGTYMSPLDPIFWAHHNMIEYCWVQWNLERGHDNTNDTGWLNFSFSDFVDGNGTATTDTVLEGLLHPIFSYQYEPSQTGNSLMTKMLKSERDADDLKQIVQKGAKVAIVPIERFVVRKRAEMQGARPLSGSILLKNAPPVRAALESAGDERLLLTIGGVHQPVDSKFYVRVFVGMPNATAETPVSDPHFAGSFAFFMGDHPAHGTSGMGEMSPGFVVDLTATLRGLNRGGALGSLDQLSVQLVPVPFAGRSIQAERFSFDYMELAPSHVTSNRI